MVNDTGIGNFLAGFFQETGHMLGWCKDPHEPPDPCTDADRERCRTVEANNDDLCRKCQKFDERQLYKKGLTWQQIKLEYNKLATDQEKAAWLERHTDPCRRFDLEHER